MAQPGASEVADTILSPNTSYPSGPSTAPPPLQAGQSSRMHTSGSDVPPPIRRTHSSLSSSSTGNGRTKRLRFTAMTPARPSSATGSDEEDVFFPGKSASYEDAEAGEVLHLDGVAKGKRRIPKDQQGYLKSDPGTPNLQETADQIRRTLSLASLDTLMTLSANTSGERNRLLKEVSRAGRDLVWRDKDDKKVFPRDTERALVLAARRALRSFILAFSVRSGVNVLLLLFGTLRRRKLRLAQLRHAIFGQEPFRFGAMIGTFTFLNTLTLHLLRLAPPVSYLRRRIRAGLFARPTFGPPEREGPEGERRWQAAVAGAVGSLGLLWETQARRTGVAQQMFVRGLQGTYNSYAPVVGINIPHGDVLLFGLCCGQIMFAFLLSPETIPREYNNWILSASRVPDFAVQSNRTAVRQRWIEPANVQKAIDYRKATPATKAAMTNLLEKIKQGWRPDACIPCEMVHPWCDNCYNTTFRRFFAVFRFMLPVYSALHLIPMLVLRRHHVQRDPLRMLARAILGITRSCSFLGVFVMIYQALFCLRSNSISKLADASWLKRLLMRKETFWAVGFSCCASLFVEEKKRRAELAMYVLPRALESVWSSARKRAWVPLVPFGETILGAGAMAMVMDAYKHNPDALSGVVRRLLFQLVGPV